MNNNTLLISFNTLTEISEVPSSLDPNLVRPLIKEVQEMRVEPLIGSKLFEKLKQDINDDALAGAYITLIEDFIRPVIVYGVLTDLPVKMGFRPTNAGFLAKTAEASSINSNSDLKTISDYYQARREFYANRLTDHLCVHHADYPEYKTESEADEKRPKNSTFETGLFLG
jgi:hypothetical protein